MREAAALSDFNMNVIVLSRMNAERLSYTDYSSDKVIISISTPGDEKAEFDSNNKTIKDILYLDFYDISYNSQEIFKGYEPMADEDAVKIRDFVLKWKDKVDTIWVHCDAGILRSAGVAAGILEALGKDNSYIFDSKMYFPNLLCYRKILNAFKSK